MLAGILNYNTGNLNSVRAALNYYSIKNIIVEKKEHFKNIDLLILPGVGSFGRAMRYIDEKNLKELILDFSEKKYLIGICLGYQILYEESEESPGVKGLGLIKGSIKRINSL